MKIKFSIFKTNILTFSCIIDAALDTDQITITNSSLNQRFVFKIKVSKSRLFLVQTGTGYIEPMSTKTIDIKLKPSLTYPDEINIANAKVQVEVGEAAVQADTAMSISTGK